MSTIARRRACGAPASGPPLGSYATAVLADSPVSYWRLDEPSGTTAADHQGLNPGTYTGGFTLGAAGATSDGDKAVTLDGSTGYVTIPDSASVRTVLGGAGALEAWVNPANIATIMCILCRSDISTCRSWEWYMTAAGVLQINMNGAGVTAGSVSLTASAWNHVAVTWDSVHSGYYVNGVQDTYIANGGAPTDVTSVPVTIGERNYTPSPQRFDGSIDEVAIYATALSAARIAAHYAAA